MHFDCIVPLGYFCGVAQEIERVGCRDESYPFDWVVSDLQTINELIENHFESLFHLDDLYREIEDHSGIVKHKKHIFEFFHDFAPDKSIAEQIQFVQEKYFRRINRFFALLNSNRSVLFICYLNPISKDLGYDVEIKRLLQILNGYKVHYKLLVIKHADLKVTEEICDTHVLKVFDVSADADDTVCRKFILNSPSIQKYLKKHVEFSYWRRIKNTLYRYRKLMRKSFKQLYWLAIGKHRKSK